MDFLEKYKEARAALKPYLLDYVQSITPRSKGRNKFVCPFIDCKSGEGTHKTGAFSVKNNMFTCFSCGRQGDIIDLYEQLNGSEEKQTVKELCAMYGGKLSRRTAGRCTKTETQAHY